jgi:hypothetical protein
MVSRIRHVVLEGGAQKRAEFALELIDGAERRDGN